MIDTYGGNKILFQKIPIKIRKDIIERYNDSCEEFSNVQITSIK
jgi:hypothetical protein